MAEHRHVRAGTFFLGPETAPQLRLNSQEREQIPGHDLARHLDRGQRVGQREARVAIGHQVFEDAVLLAKIKKIGIRQRRRLGAAPVEGADRHQPIGLGIRKRLEHDGVQRGEDGRGGANPQRERQDGGGGESLRSPKPPECVPDVARQHVDDGQRPPLPLVLLHLRHPSELAPGRVVGLGRIHAAADEPRLEHLQVGPHLVVELVVQPAPAERGHDSRQEYRASDYPLQPQHPADHAGDALPALGFTGQLLPAGPRDRIELRLPVAFRGAPRRTDPAFLQQPQQRGVDGPFVEAQAIVADLLDPPRHAVAVQRPQRIEGFQHHQVEGALQHFGAVICHDQRKIPLSFAIAKGEARRVPKHGAGAGDESVAGVG